LSNSLQVFRVLVKVLIRYSILGLRCLRGHLFEPS
jgi:hypothetical protein